MTLNLAEFRSDTEDYQANVVDTAGGSLKQFLANIDKVRSQGVELDARLARTSGFTGYARSPTPTPSTSPTRTALAPSS